MTLHLRLKPSERLIVNGALIRNAGMNAAVLRVDNDAVVIRERAIMREDEADTPAKRLYFSAQLAYADAPSNRTAHQARFAACFEALAEACRTPVSWQLLTRCGLEAARGAWWPAMQVAQQLIAHETRLLTPQPRAREAA